ncbi:phycobilisome linker polypeptide, partial [Trichinella spiralis]|uniref:phycobilisome linker polypeptide n=1 Tax=Trichinella spiralis TaxID=6334 RepID=UPI0001EFE483
MTTFNATCSGPNEYVHVQSALNEKERLPYSYLARDDYAPAFVKLFRLAHQSDGVRIVKKIKAV